MTAKEVIKRKKEGEKSSLDTKSFPTYVYTNHSGQKAAIVIREQASNPIGPAS